MKQNKKKILAEKQLAYIQMHMSFALFCPQVHFKSKTNERNFIRIDRC